MKRLGKGLGEIISATAKDGTNFVMLPIDQIRPNRFQPRASIRPESLEELKASIQRSGMIEPVVVRPLAHGVYELVAGERRLRAAQAIGIQEVPSIIRTLTNQQALEFSLIENVQRENLNPLEEARGYDRLLKEFGYTQEEIAAAVGKDRATVANVLRLLTLPEEIQHGVRDGLISLGHAKALLSVVDRNKQLELYRKAVAERFSVRETEAVASTWSPAKKRAARAVDPQAKRLEDELRRALGTKVRVQPKQRGGRIVIEYFSPDDLSRLLDLLRVSL